jgi:hypothetical protein
MPNLMTHCVLPPVGHFGSVYRKVVVIHDRHARNDHLIQRQDFIDSVPAGIAIVIVANLHGAVDCRAAGIVSRNGRAKREQVGTTAVPVVDGFSKVRMPG